jgi:hypothetical protein
MQDERATEADGEKRIGQKSVQGKRREMRNEMQQRRPFRQSHQSRDSAKQKSESPDRFPGPHLVNQTHHFRGSIAAMPLRRKEISK